MSSDFASIPVAGGSNNREDKLVSKITSTRIVLSGAFVGVAVIGAATGLLGLRSAPLVYEILGAIIGAALTGALNWRRST